MANALDEFSADLARLADLTDEELSTLESSVMAAFDAADEANDEETMAGLADALDQVRSELDKRKPAEAAEEAVPAEPAAPVEAAAVVRTTKEEKETTVASVEIPKDRAPRISEARPSVITAAADLTGYSAGAEFQNLQQFSEAFASRVNTLTRLSGGDGERVLVASIKSTVSDDRLLRVNDPEGNREKIEAITSLDVLVASGGCCAPLATKYDLFTIGETGRPVRDALAGFQADRGGIRFFPAPVLSDLGTATGFWDCTDDENYVEATPGTWKVCATIGCPTEQTALTGAITMCLTFGVLSSRVFPENVTANTKLALVQHARLADSALMANIKTGSTKLTGPAVKYGVVRDILLTVARVAAWYRDRHRLGREVPLRAILPLWILEMLRSDIIIQPPAGDGRTADFAISSSDVENFFDQWGVNITWTLDGPDPTSNGGGNYGALIDTADVADPAGTKDIPLFPTTVQWCLFVEGTWLFLDGGSLDLGIVRDSKLVRSNDYMQFSEVFESAVKIGGESLWITSPVSILGGYSPAVTA